jgi:hypothetical protein
MPAVGSAMRSRAESGDRTKADLTPALSFFRFRRLLKPTSDDDAEPRALHPQGPLRDRPLVAARASDAHDAAKKPNDHGELIVG